MAKKKDTLVPYDQISPGFEAVYTGETSSTPVQENEMISTLYSDENGTSYASGVLFPGSFRTRKMDGRKMHGMTWSSN